MNAPILIFAMLLAGADSTDFWIENAIAHHRFSFEETALATGLSAAEVERRAGELGIRPGNFAPRKDGDSLTVLPYPGGRHPRIGFLDGAVNPRRETKASVFLPWESGGYVVIDLPEAVFTDKGLIYLAHTHIPTIWDAQKVVLPPLEWRRLPGGVLESMRVLPDGVVFGARIVPRPDGAEMDLWLRNGTDAVLKGLRTQVCLLLKGAPGFEAQTADNKTVVNLPWGEAMAVRSADGRRYLAVAFERSRAWGNAQCPCFHSDPTFPDCPPGATVRVRGRFFVGKSADPAAEIIRREAQGSIIASRAAAGEPVLRGARVGAAAAEITGDDSMVIGGGIGPGAAKGQEGKLRASAVVIEGKPDTVALVACDILMIERDYLDAAARRIEAEAGIPARNVLINASHTHHAPTTSSIHGYERDEVFCGRVRDAIVDAVKAAMKRLRESPECAMAFRRGEETTVGQNSRLLLGDGTIYWVGPRDDEVRPTGPFDPALSVLAFRRPGGALEALLFNHSTHCIGVREPGKRSPGFYGLAAQDLESELGGTVAFFSGASGSTHNLTLSGGEMASRIAAAVRSTLAAAGPRDASIVRSIKREFAYRVRDFDDAKEDAAVVEYCEKRAKSEYTVDVFRKMRAALAPHRGEDRKSWIQAIRVGDVAVVGVPGEFFTVFGLEIKGRSPFRCTFIAALSNDSIGYLPDREGFRLGGYQTWTGFHSLAAPGTGERVVEEAVALLDELSQE